MTRVEKLRNTLNRKGIDALLLLHPANVSYFTGFQTQDSFLLSARNKNILITDARYSTEYRNLINNDRIHIIEISKTLIHTLENLKKELKIKNLAFERESLSFSLYEKLKHIFGKRLIPTKDIIEDMRCIKDADELRLIKKAILITMDTFKYIKKILRPGLKETDLAAEIERYIRLQGANCASFDIIVASGPNSSLPHAKKTNRKIHNNEPVLIDMGVDYKGYKSDLTRVFFLGKMSAQFRKVFNIVKTAQEKAKCLIRPGARISDIDKEVREFIANSGYADCFKHSLGHGVGLEVHEKPQIAPKNNQRLKVGMVFTLEPAIYLDNKFGIRIEDVVRVTSNGREIL